MDLGQAVPRSTYCGWKALLLLSLLLGFAAFASLPYALYKDQPTTDMVAMPTAASTKLAAAMPAPKPWQLSQARQFRQPTRASTVTNAESNVGRRDMLAKLAGGGLAAAAAQNQVANAGVQIDYSGKDKNKGGWTDIPPYLIVPPGLALTWALFNIAGPAGDQLQTMNEKQGIMKQNLMYRAPPTKKAAPRRR